MHPRQWNPDHVARWVCVTCGSVLMSAMVGGVVVTLYRRADLQSPETFAAGIGIGLGLVWYGSRTRAGQVSEKIGNATAKLRGRPKP